MLAKIGNRVLIAKFFYEPLPEHYFDSNDRAKMKKGLSNRNKISRSTTCKFYELVGATFDETSGKYVGGTLSEPIVEATTKCNPKDVYQKAYGRYLSFMKAIGTPELSVHHSVLLKNFFVSCPASTDAILDEHSKMVRSRLRG